MLATSFWTWHVRSLVLRGGVTSESGDGQLEIYSNHMPTGFVIFLAPRLDSLRFAFRITNAEMMVINPSLSLLRIQC